ncbi:MAG TPA: ABC transporter permease [Bryobacteraceae bacterium]|nr:ABC transporter permease [Bryobacteraceae bacterium]
MFQFTLLFVNRIPGRLFLRNLVERRALLAQLVRRDFEQRYVGSAAGWLWGVVHPLVLLASYIFVFQVCLKVKLPPGAVTQNYTMYLFCGVLPWLLFSETVTRSASSMVENAMLITKTVFPAEVVPVSIFLSSLIQHLIALVLVIAAAAVTVRTVSPMILLLPLYMLFIGLLGVGVGWIAASLHVYLRDTAQVLAVVMTLWFWITPIMINEQQIPPRFRAVILWNPMSWIVRAYRERLFLATWPTFQEVGILAAYSSIVFVVGGLFFRHLKRGFADVL